MEFTWEILFGISQAIITAIIGVFTKDTLIDSKYIPIQNLVIGILSGFLAIATGIYDNTINAMLIGIAISFGVGGAYDMVQIKNKQKKEREEIIMNERAKFIEINDNQKDKIEKIRTLFSEMYDLIDEICKPSRETSLVYTKLEEAQFWAIKGISREVINNE